MGRTKEPEAGQSTEMKVSPETVEEMMAAALEAAQKKADSIIEAALEEAQKRADAIVEAAEKAVKQPTGSAVSPDPDAEKLNSEMEKHETIQLFKDNGKYKDDVFVAVNGEGCNIPRGVPVQVKKKFINVLEQSDLQDMKTARFMDEESRKFEEESKKYEN